MERFGSQTAGSVDVSCCVDKEAALRLGWEEKTECSI